MRVSNRSLVLFAMTLAGACGGSDGGGSGGGLGASYNDIAQAVASPSGTVSKSSAPSVAKEFEKINETDAASVAKQSGSQSMACDDGGSVDTSFVGSGDNVSIDYDYNACCYDSCCLDGGGHWYYATTTGTDFSACGSFDLVTSCTGDSPATVAYEGCIGSDGWTYVVRVDGETYAVTGYYSNGSGSLEIRGENGTFSCEYTDFSGTCTSSDGETFSF